MSTLHASGIVTVGIPLLALVMSAAGLLVVRRVAPARWPRALIIVVAWWLLWGGLAGSGVLQRPGPPPALALMLLSTIIAGIVLGTSALGGLVARGLPLWTLVAWQAFRLPLELLLDRAALDGTMPVQMSLHGYNYDIVTGSLAVLVSVALWRGAPRVLAWLFQLVGVVLLLNVLSLALLTSPLLHHFGTAHLNVWIEYLPFVYLPTVLVTSALAGHLVLLRALLHMPTSTGARPVI